MPKLLLTFLILLFSQFIYAQFGEKQIAIQQNDTRFITHGDVNSDGKNDILAVISNFDLGTRIAWYENYQNTDFLSFKVLPFEGLFNTNQTAEIRDVNEDGINDILVFDFNLEIFIGIGNGNFTPFASIENSTFSAIQKAEFLDFDNDGDEDIVFRSGSSISLFSFVGGTELYEESILIEDAGPSYTTYTFGDIDGDGLADIIKETTGQLSWFSGENGSFEEEQIISIIDSSTALYEIHLADMNGDNSLDIVTFQSNPFEIGWFPNLSNTGTFDNYTTLIPQTAGFYQIKDMDGDGDNDVVLGKTTSDLIGWYENNGEGVLAPIEVIYEDEDVDGIPFVIADLDGDEDMDITAILEGPGKATIMFENEDGVGGFSDGKIINYSLQPRSVVTTDIDGDGDNDFVIAASTGVYWMKNIDGAGNFGEFINVDYDGGSAYPRDVFPFDADGDGDLDIMGVWNFPGHVLYENVDGNGTFSEGTTVFPYSSASSFFSDMDGDGDIDILGVRHQPYKIMWTENVGGVFEIEHLITEDFSSESFIFEDVDDDGDKDLVSRYDEGVRWRENTNGTFANPVDLLIGFEFINGIKAQDADNDGDTDLVIICNKLDGSSGQELRLYHNISSGAGITYDTPILTDFNSTASYYYFGELDGDGYSDILASESDYIYIQYGTETGFSEVEIFEEGDFNFYTKFSVGSVNSDGGKDIIVSRYFDDQLFWYDNYYESVKIEGYVFWDENENGIKDGTELVLSNQQTNLEPTSLNSWTEENGQFFYSVSPGTYTLSVSPEEHWQASQSTDYEVTVVNTSAEQNIPFLPVSIITEGAVEINSAPTRCGFTVPFWLTYTNTGTEYAKGTVSLQIDDLTTYIGADSTPLSISGNEIIWEFSDLPPTYTHNIRIELEMPGVAEIGNAVNFVADLDLTDDEGNVLHNSTTEYTPIINCAYDPNDKQVFPARSLTNDAYEENYTLFSEELRYLIRFQNTGTDTAFNVVITDNLSDNLDRTSFTPKAASHPYQTTIDTDGNVNFVFSDILLPDSLTNEPESHGFVSFTIMAKQDIPNFTQINNFAEIYFDFNPPIFTNTVNNIMVEELPQAAVADFNFDENNLMVIFEDVSENNPFAWQWDFGDTNTSELQNPTHEYTTEGNYDVCLTAQNDFGSDIICQEVTVITSSIQNEKGKKYTIKPNPTDGLTQIVLLKSLDTQNSVQFYQANGSKANLDYRITQNKIEFDVKQLIPGMYLFQISDESSTVSGKFIVK